MEIKFDSKADALYITFKKGKFFRNKKLGEDTIMDLDKNGKILGIEVLNAKKRISAAALRNATVVIS